MITCGPLKCSLATSAACRAVLGWALQGGKERSGVGRRPGFKPLAHTSPICGFSSPLPCGPSPGDDPFECLVVTYFVPSPQQQILLLALDLRFPLPPISPGWEFLLCFYFFLAPFYFCARYLRLSGWEINLQLRSRRLFLFRYEGGQERVSLTISYMPSCASSPGDPACPCKTVLRLSSCWDSQLVFVQIPTDA